MSNKKINNLTNMLKELLHSKEYLFDSTNPMKLGRLQCIYYFLFNASSTFLIILLTISLKILLILIAVAKLKTNIAI